MLGDYLEYRARPVDWSAPPEKEDSSEAAWQDDEHEKNTVADYASNEDHEDGYDPYNHPIERRILEKYLHKMK